MEYISSSPFNPTTDILWYGVKGMQWGVRRYQNKDGTLTPAGKKRYAQVIRNDHNSDAGAALRKHVKDGYQNGLSLTDRTRLKASYKHMLDALGDADDARTQFKGHVKAKADGLYEEAVSKNPAAYKGLLKAGARKDLRESVETTARSLVQTEHGDLVKRINKGTAASKAYGDVCRQMTDKLVGEYGSLTVGGFFSKLTVSDAVTSVLEKIPAGEE